MQSNKRMTESRYTGYTKRKSKNPVKSRVSDTLDGVRLPSSPFGNPSKIKGFRSSEIVRYTKRYTVTNVNIEKYSERSAFEWCFLLQKSEIKVKIWVNYA